MGYLDPANLHRGVCGVVVVVRVEVVEVEVVVVVVAGVVVLVFSTVHQGMATGVTPELGVSGQRRCVVVRPFSIIERARKRERTIESEKEREKEREGKRVGELPSRVAVSICARVKAVTHQPRYTYLSGSICSS